MKITYMSDLHLNFSPLTLEGGDVLVLAGDIVEAGHIRLAVNARRHVDIYDTYKKFFEVECRKYNHVLYVFGNHEYYNADITTARELIQPLLSDNVQILDAESTILNGVRFWGGTFWTDIDKAHPVKILQANAGMMDYREIEWKRNDQPQGWHKRFSATDGVRIHREHRKKLEEVVADKVPTVVITHHAPHVFSVPVHFQNHPLNDCYFSDMTNFLFDNPNITHWIHGHIHESNDYKIAFTNVLSNPRGYKNYEDRADRFTETFFEI